MLTLVTGGARSGKSRHAEALIADAPQVLYIATSQIFDDEMAARINIIATAGPPTGAPPSAGSSLMN